MGIRFYRVVPDWSKGVWGKVLSIILVLAILGALGTLGYVLANPAADSFTEFYIMGLSGKAADYPGKLMAGEEGKVVVGIVNREHEPVTYRVEVVIDGVKNNEVGPFMLNDGERWEGVVGFIPDKVGNNQKVEFLLYRQGQSAVYQRLYLWIDV